MEIPKPTEKETALEYLERIKIHIANSVVEMAEVGKPDDTVKLKARMKLLDKILPDQTKLDIDLRSKAPYDALMEKIKGEK